jgi:hypothetical protein
MEVIMNREINLEILREAAKPIPEEDRKVIESVRPNFMKAMSQKPEESGLCFCGTRSCLCKRLERKGGV